jgi:hypothetical protein
LPFFRPLISVREFVNLRVVLAFCTSMLAALSARADIGIGDARDDVLRQLGKPTATARRGAHEILTYPKGGRVEILDGKVVDVKGPLPTPVATIADVAPGIGATVPVPDSAPTASSTAPAPVPIESPSPMTVDTQEEYNPGAMAHELGNQVEKMDSPWGMAPPKPEHHGPLDSIPIFVTGLLIRFTFTVLALKLAFKYWEMDAFWTGILLISGIDMAVHATFQLLAKVSDGLTTVLAVESGVPGLVMIFTIHRFCFNKRIQNAIITAAAVKFVVTMCYIFAGLALMNSVFG